MVTRNRTKRSGQMQEMSRLAEAFVELDTGASLSATLIDTVNAACDRIEDSKVPTTLLVWLDGQAGEAPSDPYPARLGVHAINRWERALRRLERLPALTVTALRGVCRGPALDLLLTTDLRIAAPDSALAPAMVAGATWPGMSLYRLASALGPARARRIALLGLELPVADAAQWGLVDEVTEDLVASVTSAIARLGDRNRTELAIRRQLLAEARPRSRTRPVRISPPATARCAWSTWVHQSPSRWPLDGGRLARAGCRATRAGGRRTDERYPWTDPANAISILANGVS
jgi:isomerase DpgB